MPFEQLALEIGVGVGMGTLIALVAFLSSTDKWNNRLFAYTLAMGVVTSFVVIEGIEGGLGEDNLIKVVLLIAGASFFANKGVKMATRVRKK